MGRTGRSLRPRLRSCTTCRPGPERHRPSVPGGRRWSTARQWPTEHSRFRAGPSPDAVGIVQLGRATHRPGQSTKPGATATPGLREGCEMNLPEEHGGKHVTRRQLMERLGVVGAGAFVSQSALAWMAGPGWASVIERAARIKPAGSDLGAVEHIVFLMLENRAYDHYFGAYPRGAALMIIPSVRSARSHRITRVARILSRSTSCFRSISRATMVWSRLRISRTTGGRCMSAGTTARWIRG